MLKFEKGNNLRIFCSTAVFKGGSKREYLKTQVAKATKQNI